MPALPPGFSDHGDDGLVCRSTRWTDVLVFFLLNYVAHCFTVKAYPGENALTVAFAVICAFFLPATGIIRALDAILRHARLRKGNELVRACEAGALCMVVRGPEWRPAPGDCVEGIEVEGGVSPDRGRLEELCKMEDSSKSCTVMRTSIRPDSEGSRLNWSSRVEAQYGCSKVHGTWSLPDGYIFSHVPPSASLRPTISAIRKHRSDVTIASVHNWVKSIISIAQTVYAATTLYKTRGDQIARFGYASFGFTVTPYLLMSVLNLLGQLLTPDYPCLYMVRSAEMDEATRRGGYFEGAVASVVPEVDVASESTCAKWVVERAEGDDGGLFCRNAHTGQAFAVHGPAKGIPMKKSMTTVRVPSHSPIKHRSPRPPTSTTTTTAKSASHRLPSPRARLHVAAALVLCLLTFTIIGALSHFRPGNASTPSQRGWVAAWLVLGSVSSFLYPLLIYIVHAVPFKKIEWRKGRWGEVARAGMWWAGVLGMLTLVAAPSVGGFVVVGEMIVGYGTCTRID